MIGKSRSGLVIAAWLALSAQGALAQAAPRDLLEVQKSLVDAIQAKETLAHLARLPLAKCTTVEYHVTVGRAAVRADAAAQVAEAVATAAILPPQVAPGTIGFVSEELPALREWLDKRGDELYERAMIAHDAHDLGSAVRAYLVAVKCSPALLAREDQGLGAIGLRALRKMVDRHPEKPDLKFQLGYYRYLFGDTSGAVSALEQHQGAESDPYRKWRGRTWLATMRADLSRGRLASASAGPTVAARAGSAVATLFGGADELRNSR